MSKNILCMKWGDKYGADYVNRLYAMVARHLAGPFRFVCLTDDTNGIRKEVETWPIPELNLPPNAPERGWKKLTTFTSSLANLEGKALFLDIDIVIVDDLQPFFDYEVPFAIAKDKKLENKRIGNSSVYVFEVGAYSDILDAFVANPELIRSRFRNEQAYLSSAMDQKGMLNFWPDDWCPSFKYDCIPTWPLNYFKTPRVPQGARIILFHGNPNPDEAEAGISKNLFRYNRPSKWIGKYWKE